MLRVLRVLRVLMVLTTWRWVPQQKRQCIKHNSARMLPANGWALEEVRSKCVSEVGATPSYWVSFANACVAPHHIPMQCNACSGQHVNMLWLADSILS